MILGAYFRLIRAGYVLAREGALSLVQELPPALAPLRFGIWLGRLVERPSVRKTGHVERLNKALNRLGPTYVKFGQTLATRPDVVGPQVANDLAGLQDKMEPFDPALVPGILLAALGDKAAELTELSAPIAAASIAQVHRARLKPAGGLPKTVAVKVLRPGVEARFMADIESFYAVARLAERFVKSTKRLRPVEIVETLDRSARLELDLRLEAAAISEMAENIKDDTGFVIPSVSWDQVAQNVLTTTWVDGIPIRDHAALDAAGVDRRALASNLLQSFLKHAIRDGFFHADMHPGNLFADPRTGDVIAVDFGIMGRINRKERRFLADILYGFITRNYRLVAERHFEIGYVPKDQSVDDFALAIRSIGEPLHGRTASDISMAKVLGQLFTITDLFSMQTRPELVLLQKSMVLVEGVSRALDPNLDIWTVAEPVVGDWLRKEAGPLGRLQDLKGHFDTIAEAAGRLPIIAAQAELALADYHAGKMEPRDRLMRGAMLALMAIAGVTLLVALWRMLTL
ncbi:2-polyprenylphenol 6-hydroxylase [Devosia psychrophila]|jgi:ubiquinone biosynthesis protein|uniref:2-octaprenylphenol hydroxylase n=1 Tax=Devosia psychrophila TaxID=728005 RepID=A0A0F5Q0I2_9HYPH|nr:2-polyprenylphenol 6-hydroxylase [Devosia psychrophila]KKC34447.1 2-polyprenylphenol hydroxylase [Devosia psychrophila]SFD03388.1 2-octaprenylphenol hydroxylase [Devosia psychrophila]